MSAIAAPDFFAGEPSMVRGSGLDIHVESRAGASGDSPQLAKNSGSPYNSAATVQ
ncbi:MAG: hypothetical protein ACREPT_14520 [Rudaea sp.]